MVFGGRGSQSRSLANSMRGPFAAAVATHELKFAWSPRTFRRLPFDVLINCSIRSGYLVSRWATNRLHSGIPRCLQAACCLLHCCLA
jgi:hypothetical protein